MVRRTRRQVVIFLMLRSGMQFRCRHIFDHRHFSDACKPCIANSQAAG